MLQEFIPRLLASVPLSWRRAIIGRPDNPSRVATALHDLLNRVAPSQSYVHACQGALQGYTLYTDWTRYRSFVYGTWEPEVSNVVLSVVKPGMTVIDIGAHIGYYTLLFAKCVGADGRVISFEPFPDNFALLQKNVQLNGLSQVQPRPQAVFSAAREITLAVPDHTLNPGQGSVSHASGSRKFLVQAVCLDSFCAQEALRPDLIKMDVEGAEQDVLLGARQTIAQWRPKLLIELHHFDGDALAHPVPDLLADWGYQLHWIDRCQLTSHILAVPRDTKTFAGE